MRIIHPRFALVLALLSVLTTVLVWPAPANAQCGTQASSCKNCHEVQAQDPVNTEGAWHVDHAFSDFCEFCHVGNVTAMDKDAAHEGMVYPLEDVKASCSACHPTDYEELAVAYAGTLGIDLTALGGPDASSDSSSPLPPNASSDTGGDVSPSGDTDAGTGEAGSTGGAVFDLNNRYEDAQPNQRFTLNVGNAILVAMLLGLLVAFGVLFWKFEGLGDRWAELRGLQSAYAGAYGAGDTSPSPQQGRPAIATLRPSLEKASPATLAALNRLLDSDPVRGGQMIEALARLDARLVEVVRRLDQNDIDLLVALVRELKERA